MNPPEREIRHHSLWAMLRSAVQWILCGCVVTVMAVGSLILSFFCKPLQLDPFLHAMVRIFVWCTGVKIRVHGLEKLDPHQPYLIVFNHINMLDHFFMYYVLKRKIRGVEKESHFRWPIYGLLARRIGLVPIAPRGNTSSAIESLEKLRKLFEQGASIVVVPEGTRSYNGTLQPFKKGAFHLAVQARAPVLPMVFVGAYQIMRKHDWVMHPGPLDIYIENPVPTKGMTASDVKELTQQVRNVIEQRLKTSSNPNVS